MESKIKDQRAVAGRGNFKYWLDLKSPKWTFLNQDFQFVAHSATSGDTIIIDVDAESYTKSAGVTVDSDSLSSLNIPSTVTEILVLAECIADVVNTGNFIAIYTNGQAATTNLRVFAPPVAGYYNGGTSIVRLDSDKKFKIYINRGAGIIYLQIKIIAWR